VIRKLSSGKYRLYSRKKNPSTGRRRNLGTFSSLEAARRHERAVQFFSGTEARARGRIYKEVSRSASVFSCTDSTLRRILFGSPSSSSMRTEVITWRDERRAVS
jgi:hypothetical protein